MSATRADVLAVDTAGIEAQNVLADHIGRQAVRAGSLPYREAWLYLESRLDGLGYIRSVSPNSSPGHDVKAFLDDFNDECDPPVCTPLPASTLKRRALLMLADPMLAYAGYSWAVSYLVLGRSSAAVPTISLPHDIRYLPALRFEMTPYGTAITTEHAFVHDHRLTRVTVGIGDTGRQHAWDVGVAAGDLLQGAWWQADVSVDIWRQPTLDTPPNSQVFMTGGLAAATARIPFGRRGIRRTARGRSDPGRLQVRWIRSRRAASCRTDRPRRRDLPSVDPEIPSLIENSSRTQGASMDRPAARPL